jgi:hypothetical protein
MDRVIQTLVERNPALLHPLTPRFPGAGRTFSAVPSNSRCGRACVLLSTRPTRMSRAIQGR